MNLCVLVALSLCALMARPAQAQDDEFELEEGYYIADGMLTIIIKEGNDELVECLRWAANQDKVEIGGCTQITGLTIYGEPIAESWDRNAAFTGLTHIRTFMLFEHAPERRRYFKLFFPPFPDRLTPYRLFTFYASLPYVEYVGFIEAVRIPPEERPSAISETTWGFIKRGDLPQAHSRGVVGSSRGSEGHAKAGEHPLSWDGRDDHGREVASDVYIYRLSVGAWAVQRRMLLLR